MSMRRFTRLTNGFSKRVENHAHMVSLHFMHYNFCRQHKNPPRCTGNGSGYYESSGKLRISLR